MSVGESVLGLFLGRRSSRMASSSMSKARIRSSAKMAAREAEARVESLERELEELQRELQAKSEEITARWDEALEEFKEIEVKPRRTDVAIDEVTIAWAPHWSFDTSGGSPALVPGW